MQETARDVSAECSTPGRLFVDLKAALHSTIAGIKEGLAATIPTVPHANNQNNPVVMQQHASHEYCDGGRLCQIGQSLAREVTRHLYSTDDGLIVWSTDGTHMVQSPREYVHVVRLLASMERGPQPVEQGKTRAHDKMTMGVPLKRPTSPTLSSPTPFSGSTRDYSSSAASSVTYIGDRDSTRGLFFVRKAEQNITQSPSWARFLRRLHRGRPVDAITSFNQNIKEDVDKQNTQSDDFVSTCIARGAELKPEILLILQKHARLNRPSISLHKLRNLLQENDIHSILGTNFTTRQCQIIRQDYLQILATVLYGPNPVEGFRRLYQKLQNFGKKDDNLPFTRRTFLSLDWGTDEQHEQFLVNQYLFHPITIEAGDLNDVTADPQLSLPLRHSEYFDAGHNAIIISAEIPEYHRNFTKDRRNDRLDGGADLNESVSFDFPVSIVLTACITEDSVCL